MWKVHRFYGHRHRDKVAKMLQYLPRFKGKLSNIKEELEGCSICNHRARASPRPKVGLPRASEVNQVVSIDLKIIPQNDPIKKKYYVILYMIDEFTKIIKGRAIKDKEPKTIAKALYDSWIIGDGLGPGRPKTGFFADNGGEFVGKEFVEFANSLGVSVTHTAANAPHMNGSVERNHAIVDHIIEKIREDQPNVEFQKVIDTACMCKNSEINYTGFSPLQVYTGSNPSFLEIGNDSITITNNIKNNDAEFERMNVLRKGRMAVREAESSDKLKRILKARAQPHKSVPWAIGDNAVFLLKSKLARLLGRSVKLLLYQIK